MDKKTKLQFATICAQENHEMGNGGSHILPLHATSAFTYASTDQSIDVFSGQNEGFVYSRFGNPTISSVQKKLAALETIDLEEHGFCILTGSGLSAITTLAMSKLNKGDSLLTSTNLYGGTSEVFSKVIKNNGVDIIYVDFNDSEQVKQKVEENHNIKLIYFETPANPTLSCVNIKSVTDIASHYKIPTAIDNTFSTCYIQRPFNLGVDYVIYSTTKFLNGHGNSIAGAIIGKNTADRKDVWTYMKLMGTNCSPFDAWLINIGLKTLPLRMEKHCQNAMKLAQFLEAHPKVNKVNYPGLPSFNDHHIAVNQMSQYGGMLSFDMRGDINDAKHFMDTTEICSIAATLGNIDTLLLHPASSSHLNIDKDIRLANGITDSLIRVSVGVEDINDLLQDFEMGLG